MSSNKHVQPPTPPRAKEAPAPEPAEELTIQVADTPANVNIMPVRTVARARIGQRYYSFVKGKRLSVPRDLLPHLRRAGVIL